ncbi:hypothetical protein [Coralloluteibacterium thermophilus]|uniref:Uncharacterized protein n=1 Tax=Coralloluteibacterium thermophilum TaxID=2707049 RepID=A0ABV9NMC3_9GAMM
MTSKNSDDTVRGTPNPVKNAPQKDEATGYPEENPRSPGEAREPHAKRPRNPEKPEGGLGEREPGTDA